MVEAAGVEPCARSGPKSAVWDLEREVVAVALANSAVAGDEPLLRSLEAARATGSCARGAASARPRKKVRRVHAAWWPRA